MLTLDCQAILFDLDGTLIESTFYIERLWQDPAATRALGESARSFAASHCGEDAVVAYFENYLRTRAGWPTAGRSTDDSNKGDLR